MDKGYTNIIWNKQTKRFKVLGGVDKLPNKTQGDIIFWYIKTPHKMEDVDLEFLQDIILNSEYEIPLDDSIIFLKSIGCPLPETLPFIDI